MHPFNKKSFDCVPGMPPGLAAKLEVSNSMDLFRIAVDHHTQYMALVGAAWEDVSPVVAWFESQGLYKEGVSWLYENTPDTYMRILAINRLLAELEKSQNSANGLQAENADKI